MSEKDGISETIEDEEEVIPDPNPQLIKLQDLLKQKNTLTRYKDLLEMEREVTLKRQFKRFMNIIGIEDQKVVDLSLIHI